MRRINSKVLRFTLRKTQRYIMIFTLFFVIVSLGTVWLVQKNISTSAQITELKAKALPTDATVDPEAVRELSKRATLLAEFLPDELNLYQVIGLIDQIGRKTNFQIQSYSVQYVEDSPQTLITQTLTLNGSGTLDEFMAFLKEYKFITGKLLTVDSVNLTGKKRLLSNLTVNIYAYKPEITLAGQSVRPLSELDRLLIRKVDQYSIITNQSTTNTNYENKGNPFE